MASTPACSPLEGVLLEPLTQHLEAFGSVGKLPAMVAATSGESKMGFELRLVHVDAQHGDEARGVNGCHGGDMGGFRC